MDINALRRREVSQAELVAKTEADLEEAGKNKWVLAQMELRPRLVRQRKALAITRAIIAEVTKK